MAKHTLNELMMWQGLPLSVKVRMTEERIRGWVNEYGEDGVYVSFSGGKDSTVLLDIVRNRLGYTDVPAVFVDVPTQYPELRDFVKTFDNVVILKPKISFMEVCEKYGFPIISKEVSESVYGAKKYLTELIKTENILASKQASKQASNIGLINTDNCAELASILNDRMKNRKGGQNQRLAELLGWRTRNNQQPIQANIPDKDRSMYSLEKYKFFLDAPFSISNKCCNVMKKNPLHQYHKDTGRNPITAQMASESKLRTQKWLQNGCNGFDLKIPTSNPMSFWTEQDILLYIKLHNIPICSVYGEVVTDYAKEGQINGQMSLTEFSDQCGLFDLGNPPLTTTGCKRTGCMLCGFGCHLEKSPNRFEMLKETHPKMYDLMNVCKNNGVTFKEAIDWINEHGNMNIKY